jgi:hypothetical protein
MPPVFLCPNASAGVPAQQKLPKYGGHDPAGFAGMG